MSQDDVLLVVREAMWLILKLALPFLVVSIVIGLIIAIFQAATQIHEQTITFVPKIVAIAIMMVILGPWLLSSLSEFFQMLMDMMAGL